MVWVSSVIAGVVAAIAAIYATLMFVRWPRVTPGGCRRCGQSLRGVPGPRCPECGVENPWGPRRGRLQRPLAFVGAVLLLIVLAAVVYRYLLTSLSG